MPIYEYRCSTCNHTFEVFAKMSDPAPEACEECGAATLEKVLHPVAVHYKGSGFYSTDYGSKRKSGSSSADGSGGSDSSGGSSSGDSGSGGSSDGGAASSGDSGSSSAPSSSSTSD